MKENKNWYLIMIKNPEFLSGFSIYKLLQRLIESVAFKYILFDAVDISGQDQIVSGAEPINFDIEPTKLENKRKDNKNGIIVCVAENPYSFLMEKENSLLDIGQFIQKIYYVPQFNWGDFFLFQKRPKNWQNSKSDSYVSLVSQAETTIRVVDSEYIYIYTLYEKIVDIIKINYKFEKIIYDRLDNLDYPE